MALKWLYKNVDIFGGDPEKLTIFGGSAGAVSTHYHMISPLSKSIIIFYLLRKERVCMRW